MDRCRSGIAWAAMEATSGERRSTARRFGPVTLSLWLVVGCSTGAGTEAATQARSSPPDGSAATVDAGDGAPQGPPVAATVTRPGTTGGDREAGPGAAGRAPSTSTSTSTSLAAPLDHLVADHAIVATAVGPEVVARAEPSALAAEVGRFANPIASGGPLVFLVLHQEGRWLQVSLPVRPNGTMGWIAADDVTLTRNRFRIEVDTSDHRMVVFDSGQPVVDTPVAIGNGATPTPLGSFFLVELLAPANPAGVYGPYAFGLSGYSETLASFNGGEGVIGIHGTNDPTSIGRDVSHGCIRVPNEIMEAMAAYLPLGTPVVIAP